MGAIILAEVVVAADLSGVVPGVRPASEARDVPTPAACSVRLLVEADVDAPLAVPMEDSLPERSQYS